ncbi:MAG TPA: type I glyceraldehyde-3-phosphate dehydrogenase [Candidatus Paceibacterota bacterium]|nr:type I glyceraldehyde-3-phosphate dehydrogenase [Candidatus Paceibacterota bacterium]HOH11416.1 type I glyceraldehyde-3-phosphate dehydrogenase [Candidatus Paceibacterota bacterium]HOY11019.1 type I glyceraldehyde-3-phosphate dehydrogenase [Candidatus Paceibacterota bacterium]HPB60225.1 type I glyceraldehyde-3-phosphate dehydrogenase [Candidatus Paceibacterota bacterium]HPI24353.1 type I glyceraldehyde-3-phosphate dehydrogenase [Candidatus Paceibacterota bacterium]
MMVKVAINGLGRIGRAFFKLAVKNPEINLVAVNDLGDPANLAYLLKYDSAYGQFDGEIKFEDGKLMTAGKSARFFQEKEPTNLPWAELGVDVVLESTGVFEAYGKSKAHLDAGARKVVISAPVKDEPAPGIPGGTFLIGINDDKIADQVITSNGSCTTNCAAPVIKILDEAIGVEKALLNTTHGYTATQKLVDVADAKDWRRGRAGAINLIPSTTGAAIAVGQVIPEMAGKFDGVAVRVPVITGSMIDVTFVAKKNTTVAEVNAAFEKAANNPRWQKTFTVTKEPIVSSDILGSKYASIADLSWTKVVGGNLVKVMAWYDNEMGYAHTLVEHVLKAGR